MSLSEKRPIASREVVSASVSSDVAAAITDDAKSDNRSESYVIAQILAAHYARRLASKTKTVRVQRMAA